MTAPRLDAHVRASFPFAGVARKPGDVISPDDLATTTERVLSALSGQGLIVLLPEGSDPALAAEAAEVAVPAVEAAVAPLSGRVADLVAETARLVPASIKEGIGRLILN